jgi:hypothetical protein
MWGACLRIPLPDAAEFDSTADTTADTTADITKRAIHGNGGQPLARKSASISRFCNLRQRQKTDAGGLWF